MWSRVGSLLGFVVDVRALFFVMVVVCVYQQVSSISIN
jgi:hypothetical protein